MTGSLRLRTSLQGDRIDLADYWGSLKSQGVLIIFPEKILPVSFLRAMKPSFQHAGRRGGKGLSILPFNMETFT